MQNKALIIGNSAGIGLGLTRALLAQDWQVCGISRSETPIDVSNYTHVIAKVQQPEYPRILKSLLNQSGPPGLCVYCAGIGALLDVTQMQNELNILTVNLTGMVQTAAEVIPGMVKQGQGHFMGISSVADELISAEAPSYHASKAGFSNYLEGLALALRSRGVQVTNVRFGFVDTKMAHGPVKPFMMSVDRATQHLLKCIAKKPGRYTAPKIVIPLVRFRRWMLGLKLR